MACYLSFIDVETECEGCARDIPPGLVGWTEDLRPGRLVPVCSLCLGGLDPKLSGFQTSGAYASDQRLEHLAGRVDELELRLEALAAPAIEGR